MILWGSKETTTIISPRISFYFQSKDHILSVIQILFPIYIFFQYSVYLSNVINICFQNKIMFPNGNFSNVCFQYTLSRISVWYGFGWIVVIFEGVVRSFIKFLIVPNVKVAKLWCSSIGRTKISTCRYWVSSKLTRTQNHPFFKLWPRHFLSRIFRKKLYHVTY